MTGVQASARGGSSSHNRGREIRSVWRWKRTSDPVLSISLIHVHREKETAWPSLGPLFLSLSLLSLLSLFLIEKRESPAFHTPSGLAYHTTGRLHGEFWVPAMCLLLLPPPLAAIGMDRLPHSSSREHRVPGEGACHLFWLPPSQFYRTPGTASPWFLHRVKADEGDSVCPFLWHMPSPLVT